MWRRCGRPSARNLGGRPGLIWWPLSTAHGGRLGSGPPRGRTCRRFRPAIVLASRGGGRPFLVWEAAFKDLEAAATTGTLMRDSAYLDSGSGRTPPDPDQLLAYFQAAVAEVSILFGPLAPHGPGRRRGRRSISTRWRPSSGLRQVLPAGVGGRRHPDRVDAVGIRPRPDDSRSTWPVRRGTARRGWCSSTGRTAMPSGSVRSFIGADADGTAVGGAGLGGPDAPVRPRGGETPRTRAAGASDGLTRARLAA